MFMSHGPSINSRHRDIFHSFKAADAFLTNKGTDSYQFGKQAGFIERVGEDIGLRYHNTHVMTLHPNGDTSFNTGGWNTRSTTNWMMSNPRFAVSLYEPRSGERKPFRYSTIRYVHPDEPYKWHQGEGAREQQPTYVLHDHIRFTKRGRCVNGDLLETVVAAERAERAEIVAKRRRGFAAVRKITNKIMDALAEGIPVESETAEQLVRVTATLPGDLRDWLNFHEREGEIVMGDLAPIVEPIIRRKLTETLVRTYVPALD